MSQIYANFYLLLLYILCCDTNTLICWVWCNYGVFPLRQGEFCSNAQFYLDRNRVD